VVGYAALIGVRGRGARADGKKVAVVDDDRTIRDFGDQWSHYGSNDGFYASLELLQDVFGPLVDVAEFRGARAADVGSGTGRIVQMLLEAGAAHVVAVEPSAGVEILRASTERFAERVEVIHGPGEVLSRGRQLDFVVSIGVIQFIENPLPTLEAAREALRPGGKLVISVYAREGNELYVRLVQALRVITTRLPHRALAALSGALAVCVDAYLVACRWLPLPMRDYMRNTFSRVERDKRRLTIYDQLNPAYARYYREAEIRELLEAAGFSGIRMHHRHGITWTALGVKAA
jgi:SAM-dependent methyltransferase